MKKIFLAGGAGYIGSVATEMLLNDGYEVTCCDRLLFGEEFVNQFKSNKKFSLINTDICDVDKHDLIGHDVVINLAGISNDPACDLKPSLAISTNYSGAVHLAEKSKEAGVERYILSSSCSIYGEKDNDLSNETSAPNPVSLYARTKLNAEVAIAELSDEKFCPTFLRLATVYGLSPRMRFDLIVNIMTMHAVTKKRIIILGGGNQWRPLVHVRDVVHAFIMVMRASKDLVNGEIFNVGTSDCNFQVIDIAKMVKEQIKDTKIDTAPDDPDKRNYQVDFGKIKNTIGFLPLYSIPQAIVDIEKAIKDNAVDTDDIRGNTVNYYKSLINENKL